MSRHIDRAHQALIDEASVFCRDAREPIVQKEWRAATELLLARVRKLDMALQSLTPGGSEYVGDPDRCVARAKENLNNYRELWREAVAKQQ